METRWAGEISRRNMLGLVLGVGAWGAPFAASAAAPKLATKARIVIAGAGAAGLAAAARLVQRLDGAEITLARRITTSPGSR